MTSYSESSLTSKMELFSRAVSHWKSFAIFAKVSVLEVWIGSESAHSVQKASTPPFSIENFYIFLQPSLFPTFDYIFFDIIAPMCNGVNAKINLWEKQCLTPHSIDTPHHFYKETWASLPSMFYDFSKVWEILLLIILVATAISIMLHYVGCKIKAFSNLSEKNSLEQIRVTFFWNLFWQCKNEQKTFSGLLKIL